MGLLDILQGSPDAVSPWGALYPSALFNPLQTATGQAPTPEDAASYGMLGLDPSALQMPVPPQSAFPVQPAPPAPNPLDWKPNAAPFSFAAPGAGANPFASPINPSQFAMPPSPVPPAAAPAAAPMAAGPAVANANPAAPPVAGGDENDPIPVGKYQMPRIGSGFPDDEETGASPAAATAAVRNSQANGAAPFSLGGSRPDFSDRLSLGARGFLGNMAAGPLGAIAGGLGALISGKPTDAGTIAQQNANQTARALLEKGAPLGDVQAAAQNPVLMKALIDQYYGKDKWKVVQVGETPMGKVFMQQNELDGTMRPIPGAAGAAGGGASGAGAAAFSMPENYDPTTHRDEAFIKALDPTSRQVVEAADHGDNIPQGRNLQKYMPIIQRAIQGFDPAQYQAKMAFNREMGSGKAGYGLQVKGFQQGLEHMSKLADSYISAGNWNGLGLPDVAHGLNTAREHLSNDQSGKALSVENEAQTLAGEVGKLFSGQSGGGVHEREATRGRFNSRLSGPEAAAALQSTLDMMQGGLTSIEQARDRAYGRDASDKYNFMGPEQQAQVNHIKQVIQALQNGGTAPPAASGAAPGATGVGSRPITSGTVSVGGASIPWSVK